MISMQRHSQGIIATNFASGIPRVVNSMEEGDEESCGFKSATSKRKKQWQNDFSLD